MSQLFHFAGTGCRGELFCRTWPIDYQARALNGDWFTKIRAWEFVEEPIGRWHRRESCDLSMSETNPMPLAEFSFDETQIYWDTLGINETEFTYEHCPKLYAQEAFFEIDGNIT